MAGASFLKWYWHHVTCPVWAPTMASSPLLYQTNPCNFRKLVQRQEGKEAHPQGQRTHIGSTRGKAISRPLVKELDLNLLYLGRPHLAAEPNTAIGDVLLYAWAMEGNALVHGENRSLIWVHSSVWPLFGDRQLLRVIYPIFLPVLCSPVAPWLCRPPLGYLVGGLGLPEQSKTN